MTIRRVNSVISLVIVAVLVALAAGSNDAAAAGNKHRVYMGYQQTSIVVTQSWTGSTHVAANQEVDFGKNGNPWGYAVRFRSQSVAGSGSMTASKGSLGSSTTCTGNEIWVTWSGVIKGKVRYVHINPLGGVPGLWPMPGSGTVTEQTLGTISSSQPTGCPFDNPHLHQADATAATYNSGQFAQWSTHNYGSSSTWMYEYDF